MILYIYVNRKVKKIDTHTEIVTRTHTYIDTRVNTYTDENKKIDTKINEDTPKPEHIRALSLLTVAATTAVNFIFEWHFAHRLQILPYAVTHICNILLLSPLHTHTQRHTQTQLTRVACATLATISADIQRIDTKCHKVILSQMSEYIHILNTHIYKQTHEHTSINSHTDSHTDSDTHINTPTNSHALISAAESILMTYIVSAAALPIREMKNSFECVSEFILRNPQTAEFVYKAVMNYMSLDHRREVISALNAHTHKL